MIEWKLPCFGERARLCGLTIRVSHTFGGAFAVFVAEMVRPPTGCTCRRSSLASSPARLPWSSTTPTAPAPLPSYNSRRHISDLQQFRTQYGNIKVNLVKQSGAPRVPHRHLCRQLSRE